MDIAQLLMHSDLVPEKARNALKAAVFGPKERKCSELESAVESLHHETDLSRCEARDLLGLAAAGCCA